MTIKPVVPREQARHDVEEAVSGYLDEGSPQAALNFIDALESAFDHIGRRPATGSPRYAHELNLPGLRCWSVAKFPYVLFYVEQADHIDVWRVLHEQRDIPARLRSDNG